MAGYRGVNFGQGIADYAKIVEQGYKDREAIRQFDSKMMMEAEAQRYANTIKGRQAESEYGPEGGVVMPLDMLSNDPELIKTMKAAAVAGRQFQPKPTVIYPPNTPPPQFVQPVAPAQAPPQFPVGPTAPRAPQGQGMLRDPEVSQVAPVQDRSPAGEPQPQAMDPEFHELVSSWGGKVLPETGQIVLPNFMARQLLDLKKSQYQAQAMAARTGFDRGAAPGPAINNQRKGSGGSRPSETDIKFIQKQIEQLKASLSPKEAVNLRIQASTLRKKPEEIVASIQAQILEKEAVLAQMRGGGQSPAAPPLSEHAQSLVRGYMQTHPGATQQDAMRALEKLKTKGK